FVSMLWDDINFLDYGADHGLVASSAITPPLCVWRSGPGKSHAPNGLAALGRPPSPGGAVQ
ncbi:MAG: hypothetical protein WAO08_38740, partial [Hyphomicrobiaceae bacterium]